MQQFSTISELKSKVEALLATQEGLCIHGFGVVGEGIMAIADRDRQFEIERAALLSPDSLRAIAFVEHWIDRRWRRALPGAWTGFGCAWWGRYLRHCRQS